MAWQHLILVYWVIAWAYTVFDTWREGYDISVGDLIVMMIFGGFFAPMILWERIPDRISKIWKGLTNITVLRARK